MLSTLPLLTFKYNLHLKTSMVVESIINYIHAEKRPEEMLPFGFIIASLAILLSLWVFPGYASFAMVTFTVMAVLPLMVHVVRSEKEKQDKIKEWWKIWIHRRALVFFLFLFLGFVLAYTFWFLLLPTDVANNLYFLQINTITEINTPTGAVIAAKAAFGDIFTNNLRILALCILFSFIFGSGAIFILVWNASVMGVAMATTVKIAIAASGSGSAVYFAAFSFALIRFLIHGIPEIMSYFIGGIAGGIISFAILDIKLGPKRFVQNLSGSLKNASILILVAALLLVAATTIEVFVTPLFIQ